MAEKEPVQQIMGGKEEKEEKGNPTYIQAIGQAYKEEMRRDKTVVIWGEDLRSRIMPGPAVGLYEEFGGDRVRNTPISEVAIVEMTIGAALAGLKPIAEVMFEPLLLIAADGLILKVGTWRKRHSPSFALPIVIRAPYLFMIDEDHGMHSEAFYYHARGLKIVMPSTPYDAKGLMKSAIRDNDPVLYIDNGSLGGMKGPVPETEYLVPIGKADIKRQGKDITIVAYSAMVHRALAAAEELNKEGISAEVVDLRTLVPLDEKAILDSVKKTGRLLVVHEAHLRGGVGGDILARVVEKGFSYLKGPAKRLGGLNVPIPRVHPSLLNQLVPQAKDIIQTVKTML